MELHDAGAVLAAAGAGLFLLLGAAHAVLTLKSSPAGGALTPVDDRVRAAMTRIGGLGMAPDLRSTLWRAWVGFNLSHALGVIVVSTTTLWLATSGTPLFATWPVRLALLVVPATYLLLSLKYWFDKPTRAIGLGCALVYAGVLLDVVTT